MSLTTKVYSSNPYLASGLSLGQTDGTMMISASTHPITGLVSLAYTEGRFSDLDQKNTPDGELVFNASTSNRG